MNTERMKIEMGKEKARDVGGESEREREREREKLKKIVPEYRGEWREKIRNADLNEKKTE